MGVCRLALESLTGQSRPRSRCTPISRVATPTKFAERTTRSCPSPRSTCFSTRSAWANRLVVPSATLRWVGHALRRPTSSRDSGLMVPSRGLSLGSSTSTRPMWISWKLSWTIECGAWDASLHPPAFTLGWYWRRTQDWNSRRRLCVTLTFATSWVSDPRVSAKMSDSCRETSANHCFGRRRFPWRFESTATDAFCIGVSAEVRMLSSRRR